MEPQTELHHRPMLDALRKFAPPRSAQEMADNVSDTAVTPVTQRVVPFTDAYFPAVAGHHRTNETMLQLELEPVAAKTTLWPLRPRSWK